MKHLTACLSFFAFSAVSVQALRADVPDLIPVTGVLSDLNDVPLNGIFDVTFALYNAQESGVLLWMDRYSLEIDNGVFAVYLGENESLNVLDFVQESEIWLGVKVGSDSEAQRIPMATVP